MCCPMTKKPFGLKRVLVCMRTLIMLHFPFQCAHWYIFSYTVTSQNAVLCSVMNVCEGYKPQSVILQGRLRNKSALAVASAFLWGMPPPATWDQLWWAGLCLSLWVPQTSHWPPCASLPSSLKWGGGQLINSKFPSRA